MLHEYYGILSWNSIALIGGKKTELSRRGWLPPKAADVAQAWFGTKWGQDRSLSKATVAKGARRITPGHGPLSRNCSDSTKRISLARPKRTNTGTQRFGARFVS